MEGIKEYLDQVRELLDNISIKKIEEIMELIYKTYLSDRFIFLLGNGGSAATASHFACDLGKGTVAPYQKRMKVMALTDNIPVITAWANDTHYEYIFSEQLAHFVSPGDLVIGISGSGKSKNVLNAIKLAKECGALTVGLTGFDGGEMKDIVDYCLIVSSNNMQQIEDCHLIITHLIFSLLRDRIAKNRIHSCQ
ncbi:MAG: SIS domain-containing protein [Proteobacteria bacterium]|nr:SIS domain-containing protein [Pseudomonadota bacterium]